MWLDYTFGMWMKPGCLFPLFFFLCREVLVRFLAGTGATTSPRFNQNCAKSKGLSLPTGQQALGGGVSDRSGWGMGLVFAFKIACSVRDIWCCTSFFFSPNNFNCSSICCRSIFSSARTFWALSGELLSTSKKSLPISPAACTKLIARSAVTKQVDSVSLKRKQLPRLLRVCIAVFSW